MIPNAEVREYGRSRVARGYAACPNCKYEFGGGEQVYACEVCGKDCCTNCTDTTAKHEVICGDCNEAA